ncbi:hypothetical protein NSK_007517 [Nannochloropsis salina CCMP1776]|uniref:Adaptor protein ClpS core domain-containing protein n=1 Tax=Nannochloropsis salina CCMP1776 TaxID=1027361 RepID=A0A4D9CUG5_9STRA|nr:hypothetical protein NSK_007517 [Nannochloropsis salina CCMP1776]|eukprot:TFJ81175.1 hypothetical protein NSK_007517 [Nannochloropsis salina CCMP1776]
MRPHPLLLPFLLLISLFVVSHAFLPPPLLPSSPITPSTVTALSPGKPNLGKGGAVLQKPQLQTATRVGPPKNKEKTEERFETKEEESEKFAVVLVGDKDYDQGHVVKVLCKVIAGLGAMKAVTAFQEAQSKGKAIVLIADEESAETVAELICRNKPPVIADVEPLRKGD